MLVLFFANVLRRAGKQLLQALLSEKWSKIAPGLTRTLFGGYYFWQFIGFSRTAQVQSGSTCHAPPARLDVGRVAPCATFLPSPENGSWHHAGSRDLREIPGLEAGTPTREETLAHSKKIVWLPLICILFMGLGLVFQADNALAQGKKSAQAKPQSVDSRGIWLERAKKNTDFMRGKASWYGNGFHTGATASGVPYDMYTFTAAHRTLPFGTIVRVTDQHNGKSVMVCVTDRGPFVKGRIIDMSYAAADRIGLDNKGVSTVNLEVVSDEKGKPLDAAQAFFVELDSAAGAERYGPYDNFADAAALQQALSVAHPKANVVLDHKASTQNKVQ